ncbi:MAG: hypothetical protein WBG86_17875 [Polyangiales bacterium]
MDADEQDHLAERTYDALHEFLKLANECIAEGLTVRLPDFTKVYGTMGTRKESVVQDVETSKFRITKRLGTSREAF